MLLGSRPPHLNNDGTAATIETRDMLIYIRDEESNVAGVSV